MMPKWSTDQIPSLEGKIAVVTGANSGIGYWTAYWLAKNGAEVVIAARNAQKAETALQKMRDAVDVLWFVL